MPDVFAPLADVVSDFESRPGQVRMEQAVDEALGSGEHLAVEAPCGIGKTFAYLLPAIRRSIEEETSVVVCTANIALQEQLIEKDLPTLATALDENFSWALIKGINNYLCLDRFYEAEQQMLLDKDEVHDFQRISEWVDETSHGDRSELEFEPKATVWSSVNGVSELCTGHRCKHFDGCFPMNARKKLRGANIIICNYHLFFAHLRVRMLADRDVILPPFKYLICDEAHEMADVARDFFGLRLTPWSITHLVRAANHLEMRKRADVLRKESRNFFDEVGRAMGSNRELRIRKPDFADGAPLLREVKEFQLDLERMRAGAEEEETRDRMSKFCRAAEAFVSSMEGFLKVEDENMVYWAETDQRRVPRLQSTLIDVSGLLRSEVFDEQRSVILTSATLTTGGSFDFLRKEVGLEEGRDEVVESPFDFEEQCRLIIPSMKTDPRNPGFLEEMSGNINSILEIMGGRTMCLFTSYRNLKACADAAESTGVRILRQGDLPRTRLLNEFRQDEGTALFATASFWQGVDVPGDALSCLVIDKLPFIPPDNPLLTALQERDPRCFMNYSLPRAILSLRQGFGRLIRRRDDRGVVVMFDRRLRTARYGQTVLKSLPGAPILNDLGGLESFLNS